MTSLVDKNNASKTLITVWRWHFYAGLFCIPFVIVLSISGAIYLFKPQIEQYNEARYNTFVQRSAKLAVAEPYSANRQIQAALSVFPDAKFHQYRLPKNAQSAVKVSIFSEGKRYLVYIDPYNLAVLANVPFDEQFIQLVRRIHGELLAGNIGSILVELASCWAIVLILSGLYLWWPRNTQKLAGIVYPRLSLKGRALWKDIHAVTGIWAAFFTLFLLVSGLPWALVWGSAFKELRNFDISRYMADIGVTSVSQDWAINTKQQAQSWRANAVANYDLNDHIYQAAIDLNFVYPVELSVSDEQSNSWKVASNTQNRPLRQTAWLASDGSLEANMPFASKKIVDKIVAFGIAAHEGALFGWFNQLLGVLTAVALLVISSSGFIMWRKRKPKQTLGAPAPQHNVKLGRGIVAITLVASLFLPLLLASLVVLLVLEYAVLRRVNLTRNWLGLRA